MKNIISFFSISITVFILTISCTNEDKTAEEPSLIIKFKFDPNQARLNNRGVVMPIPPENAAQTPIFNTISAHYFELAQTANTPFSQGEILYHAPEVKYNGVTAIDFNQAKIVSEGETFLKIPLKNIKSGTYQYVRVSVSYQNYQIDVLHSGAGYRGTLASFVGFNTYITSHSIGNNLFNINDNKLQGYWAFALNNYPYSSSGNGTPGTTTVPNPLFATSAIPPNSCVVTGKFVNDLVIGTNETKDITVTLSLSINKSFEWRDTVQDGRFEPAAGDYVVDMGLRGLIPSYSR
jgi:hypothetical protein